MSSSSFLQRFTYDWLVRFCELHPLDKSYFKPDNTDCSEPWHDCSKCYKPAASKYSKISLCFANIVAKFMPYIQPNYATHIYNGLVKENPLQQANKTIVMIGYILFHDFTPGNITKFFTHRYIYFNLAYVVIRKSTLNLVELLELLKGAKKVTIAESLLTKPLLFSTIWPLLRHWGEACIDLENLIYDEKIPEILANTIGVKPSQELSLGSFDLCKIKVLAFVDYFIATPGKPYFQFTFNSGYSPLSSENMTQMIEEKFKATGYTVDKDSAPSGCEGMIGFCKGTDSCVSLRYLDWKFE